MVLLVLFFFCHVELEIPVHEISLAIMFGVIWHWRIVGFVCRS